MYNIRGQKVKTLFDGTAEKGVHRLVWDGRDGSGRSVASGIYLIHLESSGKSSIRKAMLMK
jgi:flagellar hook assembly protein FlgD